jgi:segregation and condensation protein B
MERGLVRIGGEEDSLGRPFLYETTRQFLEVFGLRGLDALPMAETLRKTKALLEVKPDPADAESESAA